MHILFLVLLTAVSAQEYVASKSTTEFVEPLKNITAAVGTNVDFTCSVRHLGTNSRIMWLRQKNNGPQAMLAVNTLRITKNHKMSVSLLSSSDLVTNSILYIYNVEPEEAGVYTCSVNTDSSTNLIMQKGSLEVFTKPSLPRPEPTTTPKPVLTEAKSSENSEYGTIFCFNFSKMWKDTKRETGDFVTNIWNKLSNVFSKYRD